MRWQNRPVNGIISSFSDYCNKLFAISSCFSPEQWHLALNCRKMKIMPILIGVWLHAFGPYSLHFIRVRAESLLSMLKSTLCTISRRYVCRPKCSFLLGNCNRLSILIRWNCLLMHRTTLSIHNLNWRRRFSGENLILPFFPFYSFRHKLNIYLGIVQFFFCFCFLFSVPFLNIEEMFF